MATLANASQIFPFEGEFSGQGKWETDGQNGKQDLLVRIERNQHLVRIELLIQPDGYNQPIRNFYTLRIADGVTPEQNQFSVKVIKGVKVIGKGACRYTSPQEFTCEYSYSKPAWIRTEKGLLSGEDEYRSKLEFVGSNSNVKLTQSGGSFLTYKELDGVTKSIPVKTWSSNLDRTSEDAWILEPPMSYMAQNEIAGKLEVCLSPKKTSLIPKEYMFEPGFFCDPFSNPAPTIKDKDLRISTNRVVNFSDKTPAPENYSYPATQDMLQKLNSLSLKLADYGYNIRFLISPDILGFSDLNTRILMEFNRDQANHFPWFSGDDFYNGDGTRSPSPTREPGFMLVSLGFSSEATPSMEKEIERTFGKDFETIVELMEIVNPADQEVIEKFYKSQLNRHIVEFGDHGLQGSIYQKYAELEYDVNNSEQMDTMPKDLKEKLKAHQNQYLERKKALREYLQTLKEDVEKLFSQKKFEDGINKLEMGLIGGLNKHFANFDEFKKIN